MADHRGESKHPDPAHNSCGPRKTASPALRRRAVSGDGLSTDVADAAMAAAQRLLARLDPAAATSVSTPPHTDHKPHIIRTAAQGQSVAGGIPLPARGQSDSVDGTAVHAGGFRRMRSGSGEEWSNAAIRTAAGIASRLASEDAPVHAESKESVDEAEGESKAGDSRSKQRPASLVAASRPGDAFSTHGFRV